MTRKMYWGLAFLIVLLIATTTVVVIRSNNETQRLRDELAQLEEAQKKAENTPHTVDFSETKPPDVPGFVWVRHGDHWDKVPIDAQIADVSDGSLQQTGADQQVLPDDAALIRSLVLDTLQKTEQELTESQRDQLKRALDYVRQNGITKAQLEQLKQSLEREAIRDARAAAEKAANAKAVEKIKADYELLSKKHDIADKIAALNRQMHEIGVISKDGELLPGNFSSEQIKEALRQRRELRRQQRQLYAEFHMLTEESGNDD